MKARILAVGALLLIGLAASNAIAHHSFPSEFDLRQKVHLQGTVVQFEWSNPHTWISLDIEVDGHTERWRIQGGAPSALLRRGWNRDMLPTGTAITVDAFRARDGSRTAGAQDVVLSGSRKMSLGNPTIDPVVGY